MKHKIFRAFAALVVLAAALSAASAGASVQGEEARSEHQRIVEFWTPDRIASAQPRDFVLDPSSGNFHPNKPGNGNGNGGGNGDGKPGDSGDGGDGGTPTVAGSSWRLGQEVADTTGKIFFEMSGSYYVCSGSVATESDSGRSVVLTAGHCVFDESNDQFATNWLFIPNYDASPASLTVGGSFCVSTEHGCWTASALVAHEGFTTAGGFNDQAVLHDFAFAVVGDGGHGNAQLDATVGSQVIAFNQGLAADTDTYLFGYPAEKKYKGKDLIYCRGPLGTDPLNSNLTYRVDCNMNGGASGGPWFTNFDESTGTGTLSSVNSYGYTGINAMHGPVLDANALDTWNAALSTNSDVEVP